MKESEPNPVSVDFNPYSEWLELSATVTSPSHYQLLGLDESVADPAVVASAADRVLTRVRARKPGPHAAAWAQLLDRIAAAKAVLTDPTQRQRYDQQMSTDAATSASPSGQILLPPSNTASHPRIAAQASPAAIDPMAPFALQPQAVAPQVPLPTQAAAAIPAAVPYLQPALAPPNPMAPVATSAPMALMPQTVLQPSSNPMAPLHPATPVAHAIPIAPSPTNPIQPGAIPTATPMPMQAVPLAAHPTAPVAQGTLVPQPAVASPLPTLAAAPKLKRKPTVKARARSKAGGSFGPILLGGSVGGLIVVVVGIGFYLSGSKSNRSSQPVAAVTPEPFSAGGFEATTNVPRRLDEMPASERPRPTVATPSTATSPQPEPSPPPMTEPAPDMTPTPDPPPPPPDPRPASGPSRDEIRELARSLTTARAAIGELNFPDADREIATAQAVAVLEEHQAKIGRLQLLREYVSRYQAAIGETLGRVNAGDQIELDNGVSFGIVELTPDFLIIRISGRNRRYPMKELPLGLATRLAEMSLDKALPDTFAMKAAYVSINPRINDEDRKKADEWWKEAASVGDVQDLIMAINDDYSLQQDVMEVPLAPGAMAELTARADRLKDAHTIDEFAKEFQAAIDESLKTLEPEMELSVGGSTTVIIKEIKPDRLMLTVAGETRGFQLTKLPLGLAASIAERILPRDAPLYIVMKGAYFAARDNAQSKKQFRPFVVDWWKQAGEMDQQLQDVIQELVTQYPE